MTNTIRGWEDLFPLTPEHWAVIWEGKEWWISEKTLEVIVWRRTFAELFIYLEDQDILFIYEYAPERRNDIIDFMKRYDNFNSLWLLLWKVQEKDKEFIDVIKERLSELVDQIDIKWLLDCPKDFPKSTVPPRYSNMWVKFIDKVWLPLIEQEINKETLYYYLYAPESEFKKSVVKKLVSIYKKEDNLSVLFGDYKDRVERKIDQEMSKRETREIPEELDFGLVARIDEVWIPLVQQETNINELLNYYRKAPSWWEFKDIVAARIDEVWIPLLKTINDQFTLERWIKEFPIQLQFIVEAKKRLQEVNTEIIKFLGKAKEVFNPSNSADKSPEIAEVLESWER